MKNFLLTLFVLIISSKNVAAQGEFNIYPVSAIFISEQAVKNKVFIDAISDDGNGQNRIYAINRIQQEFDRLFTEHASNINDFNKHKTFVAYISVPRASLFQVQKSTNAYDLYMPLTMTISIVNMVTGEALYSYSYTNYAVYSFTSNDFNNKNNILALYRSNFNSLLSDVLNNAKSKFNPQKIDCTVFKKWKSDFILNKGVDKGIVKGDVLSDQYGNQLSVIHSDLNYSVAQELFGEPQDDSSFYKFSNYSINDIKKPKIALVNIEKTNLQNMPDSIISQIFSDSLGEGAKFSIIDLDKRFYESQEAVLQLTNLKNEVTKNRELPDFFLNLYLDGVHYANYITGKSFANIDKYSIKSCGDIIDHSGRVIYSTCVNDEIVDKNLTNYKFSNENRKEILVKNSLLKLAENFNNDISIKNIEIPITFNTKNQQLYVEDNQDALSIGMTVNTYKHIGEINNQNIYVPSWEASVFSRKNKTKTLNLNLPFYESASEPQKGDKIIINTVGSTKPMSSSLMEISFSNSKMGEGYTLNNFNKVAFNAISSSLNYPVYDFNNHESNLNIVNNGIYGFKQTIKNNKIKLNQHIYPVYKINKISESNQGQMKKLEYSVLTGIKITENGNVVFKKALQQKVTINTPVEHEKEVVNLELSNYIFDLLYSISKDINLRK